MDILLKLFDMFNSTIKLIVEYIPHDKESFFSLLKQSWNLLGGLNVWIGSLLGVDIHKITDIIINFIIKYLSLAFDFLMELLKRLAERA